MEAIEWVIRRRATGSVVGEQVEGEVRKLRRLRLPLWSCPRNRPPDGDSGFFRGFPNGLGFSSGSDGSSSSVVLDLERSKVVRAPSRLEGGGALDAKTAMAMKSHCEAERRRRERINGHLAVPRSMVPCANKVGGRSLFALLCLLQWLLALCCGGSVNTTSQLDFKTLIPSSVFVNLTSL
ncbi:hypothetical protein BHM03_00061974 [Ensete ventricosum]|nr:hypothetical protein BHM03_00061974 [Ensete ventricosum]